MISSNSSIVRIIKIFLLSIITAIIPYSLLSYMWGGYDNVSLRIVITIFVINTIPCIIINILYHRYYYIREMISSFYFYISFFLTFLLMTIRSLKLLKGNTFDYLEGFIMFFILAESMAVFIYITYIFIKYIKCKYSFSNIEKAAYLITGMLFAYFVIFFTSFTSALTIYLLD